MKLFSMKVLILLMTFLTLILLFFSITLASILVTVFTMLTLILLLLLYKKVGSFILPGKKVKWAEYLYPDVTSISMKPDCVIFSGKKGLIGVKAFRITDIPYT